MKPLVQARAKEYWRYLMFCLEVKSWGDPPPGIAPLHIWTPQQWAMMTDVSVVEHWDRVAARERTSYLRMAVESARAMTRMSKKDEYHKANLADAIQTKLRIGELRKDGTVHPQSLLKGRCHRQKATSSSRGGILSRTCHVCREELPVDAFYARGNSTRAMCKVCEKVKRQMKAHNLTDPRDREAAERAIRSQPIRGRKRMKLPAKAWKNWCPECRDYRPDNHIHEPLPIEQLPMAAD